MPRSMRERIARAIHEAPHRISPMAEIALPRFEDLDANKRGWLLTVADVVLAEMQEPTEAMLLARMGWEPTPANVWQVMIEAAAED